MFVVILESDGTIRLFLVAITHRTNKLIINFTVQIAKLVNLIILQSKSVSGPNINLLESGINYRDWRDWNKLRGLSVIIRYKKIHCVFSLQDTILYMSIYIVQLSGRIEFQKG